MDNQTIGLVQKWHGRFNDRQKLQHIYALVAVLSFFIAGVVSLLNQDLGRTILYITGLSAFALVANGVIWALLFTNVLVDVKPARNIPAKRGTTVKK